jgi:hypothetical protein
MTRPTTSSRLRSEEEAGMARPAGRSRLSPVVAR